MEISKRKFRELCKYAIHYKICYCYLCGQPIIDGQHWNLDHVHPKSKGGANTPANLRPVHYYCNQAKADMTIEQWRQRQR